MEELRIDKWLWAARFFKTRSLAQAAIENGRVLVGGERVKVSRGLKVGEQVTIKGGDVPQVILVRALSDQRRGAPEARVLYQETPASIEARELARERRRMFVEPSAEIRGRPTKRDRRRLGGVGDDA